MKAYKKTFGRFQVSSWNLKSKYRINTLIVDCWLDILTEHIKILFNCREHSPLKPRGLASAPKFVENSQNKFLANEEENAYVQLEVFGDPAPSITWFR